MAHLLSYHSVNVVNVYTDASFVQSLAISLVPNDTAKQISLLIVHVIIAIIVSCLLQGPQKPLLPGMRPSVSRSHHLLTH